MYEIKYEIENQEYAIPAPGFLCAEAMAESLYYEHGAEIVTVYNPEGECCAVL